MAPIRTVTGKHEARHNSEGFRKKTQQSEQNGKGFTAPLKQIEKTVTKNKDAHSNKEDTLCLTDEVHQSQWN